MISGIAIMNVHGCTGYLPNRVRACLLYTSPVVHTIDVEDARDFMFAFAEQNCSRFVNNQLLKGCLLYTSIISTHQVRDIDKILDHVVIMDNSHVLLDASTANICSKCLLVRCV